MVQFPIDEIDKKLLDFFLNEKPRTYKRKQVILNGNDEPPGVFYIAKGHVKVYSITEKGDEKIFIFYKLGEVFPLIWTFRGYARSAFFEAMDDVVVHKVDRELFLTFLKKNPEVMFNIIKRIIDITDVFVDRIYNLEYTTTYQRLIVRLLAMTDRFGKQQNSSIVINLPITHQDLAATIAMTRETVSRDMEELVRKGLITQKNHIVTIIDKAKLQEELTNHLQEH